MRTIAILSLAWAAVPALAEDASESDLLPALREGWSHLGTNEQGFHRVRREIDGAVMIWIPPGEFLMGSVEGEGRDNEHPQRLIHLDGYFIDEMEVTWRQYLAFCRSTGHVTPERPGWAGDDHPVVNVTWDDAQAYAAWAGGDLPTEAQWEKAARGTDGRKYPWGSAEPDGTRANFADRRMREAGYDHEWIDARVDDGHGRTAAVGSYAAGGSPFGCQDMAGNVWEWCLDWYGKGIYWSMPERNPVGDGASSFRILRGGGWFLGAVSVRAANRGKLDPGGWDDASGLRVAARP